MSVTVHYTSEAMGLIDRITHDVISAIECSRDLSPATSTVEIIEQLQKIGYTEDDRHEMNLDLNKPTTSSLKLNEIIITLPYKNQRDSRRRWGVFKIFGCPAVMKRLMEIKHSHGRRDMKLFSIGNNWETSGNKWAKGTLTYIKTGEEFIAFRMTKN